VSISAIIICCPCLDSDGFDISPFTLEVTNVLFVIAERIKPTPDHRRSEKSPVIKIVVGSLVALFVVIAIIVG